MPIESSSWRMIAAVCTRIQFTVCCGKASTICVGHMQIPIRVVYLDRSMAAFAGAASEDAAAVNHHNFVPEAMQSGTTSSIQPRVHLLYRPGHYDILYVRPAS